MVRYDTRGLNGFVMIRENKVARMKVDLRELEAFLKTMAAEPEDSLKNLTEDDIKARISAMHAHMPTTVRELLNLETMRKTHVEIENCKGRVLPLNQSDWQAVDNLVRLLWYFYMRQISDYVATLDNALHAVLGKSKLELHPSVRLAIAAVDTNCTVLSTILSAHFDIYQISGRDNNADLHYDRIINQAVPALKSYLTKGNTNGEPRSSDRQDVPAGEGDRSK
jgi:hypothetical protein